MGHGRCLPRRTCEAHSGTRAQSGLCTLPHDIMFTARRGPRTPPPSRIVPSSSNVCPSRSSTDGHEGSWKQQGWPQHCACQRGVVSPPLYCRPVPAGLGLPLWAVERADPVLAARVHCCSGTRSDTQIVAQRETQIFSPWDVDVPFSSRTELGFFCRCTKLRFWGERNNIQNCSNSLRSVRASLPLICPSVHSFTHPPSHQHLHAAFYLTAIPPSIC